MTNYLKVNKRQQVLALLELGWTYRRIEAETGVRRETVSRYDRIRQSKAAKVFPGSTAVPAPSEGPEGAMDGSEESNPAKTFPGSDPKAAKVFAGSQLPPRSGAAAYHDVIVEKLDLGLTVQRIWQDLVEAYGYGYSYESVKRYIRRLERPKRAVGVYFSDPGEEAQVDFFQGAPTLDAKTGRWKRPSVFRLTLCHSRHGYEEAVWNQQLETFLRLHENAFHDIGGVPKVLRHDNMSVAVVRACFYDPDIHPVWEAFAKHWGFTPLPTRPRNPKENGKQERSGGYVKDNALKGRRFESLEEQNEHLRRWNRTIARLRIHGTTRRQVWTHFLETDKPALRPLAPKPFTLFTCGRRTVHPDGHVEVGGSFYPVPTNFLGHDIQARWDRHLVRLFYGDTLVAVHNRVAPGLFAPRAGGPAEPSSRQQAYVARLLGRCERVGPELRRWAEEAIEERGIRALRLIQGVVGLTRSHPKECVLHAARQAGEGEPEPVLLTDHPTIRPMADYSLEDFS
jgi:transposase